MLPAVPAPPANVRLVRPGLGYVDRYDSVCVPCAFVLWVVRKFFKETAHEHEMAAKHAAEAGMIEDGKQDSDKALKQRPSEKFSDGLQNAKGF